MSVENGVGVPSHVEVRRLPNEGVRMAPEANIWRAQRIEVHGAGMVAREDIAKGKVAIPDKVVSVRDIKQVMGPGGAIVQESKMMQGNDVMNA